MPSQLYLRQKVPYPKNRPGWQIAVVGQVIVPACFQRNIKTAEITLSAMRTISLPFGKLPIDAGNCKYQGCRYPLQFHGCLITKGKRILWDEETMVGLDGIKG